MDKKAKTALIIVGTLGLGYLAYQWLKPKEEEEGLEMIMKLYQSGVDIGSVSPTKIIPNIETTVVATVTNTSKYGGNPVAVPVTVALVPQWGTTSPYTQNTVAVTSQNVTVPANGSIDVTFKFTYPTASNGGQGYLACQVFDPDGIKRAEKKITMMITSAPVHSGATSLAIYDGATLIPVGAILQVGKFYTAAWTIKNNSTILGIPAADIWMPEITVNWRTSAGIETNVTLLDRANVQFAAGETKTGYVPFILVPANMDQGTATFYFTLWVPGYNVFWDALSQANVCAAIGYDLSVNF